MNGSDTTRSYLVECYWPGVSAEALHAAAQRTRKAASDLQSEGADVDFISSILVVVDETVFCLFRGCEADVRAASTRAGVQFERVLESVRADGRTEENE